MVCVGVSKAGEMERCNMICTHSYCLGAMVLLEYQLRIVIVYANKLIPFVLVLIMCANVLHWTG